MIFLFFLHVISYWSDDCLVLPLCMLVETTLVWKIDVKRQFGFDRSWSLTKGMSLIIYNNYLLKNNLLITLYINCLILLFFFFFADLSKNRFIEIPSEIFEYRSAECLNCYHNAIKFVPEALLQLQNLTHLCLRFV